MLMPMLARYMTRHPQTITRTATMADAHRVMRAHQIRHLPVMDGARVVGLVSVHDLHLLETLPGVSPDEVDVEDAMSTDVYFVSERDELPDVVDRMADAKIGSAVVLDADGGLLGIFTTIDALRALADILRREAA
jgi:acetoin utilization protein AcuB